NRAAFAIKSAKDAGMLVEVVFRGVGRWRSECLRSPHERSEIRDLQGNPAYRCAHAGYKRSCDPFTKTRVTRAHIACPIFRQQALPHIGVERRVGPVAHAGNETVLHRIEVNVVDVTCEILVIANRVLPKASLPKQEIAVRM